MPTRSCFFRGHRAPWGGSGEGSVAQGSRGPSVQLLLTLISKEPINAVFRVSASAVFPGLARSKTLGPLARSCSFPGRFKAHVEFGQTRHPSEVLPPSFSSNPLSRSSSRLRKDFSRPPDVT